MANLTGQHKSSICTSSLIPIKSKKSSCQKSFQNFEKQSYRSADEVDVLKKKISELRNRCSDLIFQNDKLGVELEHEKCKVVQLERKLQFVKDNQVIFEKLREAYVNVKYNESAGRKLIEIRDKSVQTWDGVLCRACLDTEKLRQELEKIKTKYDNCFIIQPQEMISLSSTVQELKNNVFKMQTGNEENSTASISQNEDDKSLKINLITKKSDCQDTMLNEKKTEMEAKMEIIQKSRIRCLSLDRIHFIKVPVVQHHQLKSKSSRSAICVNDVNLKNKRLRS